MRRCPLILLIAVGMIVAGLPATAEAEPGPGVEVWLTDLGSDERLARQDDQPWTDSTGSENGADDGTVITVDPTRTYQRMTGFGASMTDSSGWVLSRKLSKAARQKIMRELFSVEDGIGLSMLRQPMGASDFAVEKAYSYDDQPAGETDPDLSDFSIDHDRRYLLPRLEEALKLNPELAIMATPVERAGLDEGQRLDDHRLAAAASTTQAYANYFVEFLKAVPRGRRPDRLRLGAERAAVRAGRLSRAWGCCPTRPPPSSAVTSGRRSARAGLDTTILGYDHNWDVTDYPGGDVRTIAGPPLRARHRLALLRRRRWGAVDVAQQLSAGAGVPDRVLRRRAGRAVTVEAFGQTMDSVIGGAAELGPVGDLLEPGPGPGSTGPFIGGCTDCRGVVTVNDDGTV